MVDSSIEDRPLTIKVLSLIEKTKSRLNQLDHKKFPSEITEKARKLLLNILDKFSNPNTLNPSILSYQFLLELQSFVDDIESSTIDHISWPIISYCDEIWNSIFNDKDRMIFYSLTRDHNYYLYRFSNELIKHLNVSPLISSPQINELLENKVIYCLNLASLEKENVPLYAMIGHEFGHAVFHAHYLRIEKLLVQNISNLFNQLEEDSIPENIISIIKVIVRSYAIELFSDLIGTLIMGPAFLLAFYEITWGTNKSSWSIQFPISENKPYPSRNFRMELIKSNTNIEDLIIKINDLPANQESDFLHESTQTIIQFLETIPSNDIDNVEVGPVSFSDKNTIKETISSNLEIIKKSLKSFISDCKQEFNTILQPVDGQNVAELLRRFKHKILPNIIPDSTLLGQPAEFQDILNACTIHRFNFLNKDNIDQVTLSISKEIQMIERLTEKSLEVSFVQKKYKKHQEL